MSLLFVHNIRIKRDEAGNLYTHSSYNKEVWNRYYTISKELSVITRPDYKVYKENDAKQRFEFFDVNKINNIEIVDHTKSILAFINPINRYKKNKILQDSVKSHDVVIARVPSEYGYTAIKHAKRYKKPYIIEVVGCGWDSFWNHSLKRKILAPLSYFKQRKYVRSAKYTIYVTNNFLQRRYPTKGESVNCSNVMLTRIEDSTLKKRLNKIKNVNQQEKLIIGTTASVDVRFKGQQYIIEALGKLKKEGKTNFEYQLVGNGDPAYLKSVARDNNVLDQVKFMGSMPHEKVFKWLDTIDIYTQPSRQEGLPRALIEAMSRGLPAFGANTAGIPELLNKNFIFTNSKNNINEICEILNLMSKNEMSLQATHNFEKSKKYEKNVIEQRRQTFFRKFKDDINFNP